MLVNIPYIECLGWWTLFPRHERTKKTENLNTPGGSFRKVPPAFRTMYLGVKSHGLGRFGTPMVFFWVVFFFETQNVGYPP